MKNKMLKKTIVIGIIILFIGIAIQPSLGDNIPEKIEVEPKDYLFQTIIDIANNPEVQSLFEQIEDYNDIINCNYNLRNTYFKLLIRKPSFFFSTFRNKPTVTHEYLNYMYNQGCDIINIIGEKKSIEIIESIEITNPEFFNELNNIIMNNEDLTNKISTLAEMNEELKSDRPFIDGAIICAIAETLFFALMSLMAYLDELGIMLFGEFPILYALYVIPVIGTMMLMIWPFMFILLNFC